MNQGVFTTEQITHNLIKVARAWLDSNYPLRQQAIEMAAPEFCLDPKHFAFVLDWIFSLWTEEKIREGFDLCRVGRACPQVAHPTSAVQILAGTTPAMIAQGFFQGAILNIPQALKIPSHQPTFARLLHQSFTETPLGAVDNSTISDETPLFSALRFSQQPLGSLFTLYCDRSDLSAFYLKLREADWVFAYGRDETMTEIQSQLKKDAVFIAHGHAESVAIVFKEAANLHTLEKLAYDFLSYNQRGCLSPLVTFIEEGGELSPVACVKVFAEQVLPAVAKQLPRGGLFAGEAEAILHQRNLSRFRGPVYCGEDWTVSYDDKQTWPDFALPRFMLFQSFNDTEAFIKRLQPMQEKLICVGYAGLQTKIERLQSSLPKLVCELGSMQKQLLVF